MTKRNDLVVFILTHGRADNMKTDLTLRKQGYTGPIYYVIDDEDEQEELYREKYGEYVLQFSKTQEAERTDVMDNFGKTNGVVFARNKSQEMARELGYKYMLQFDDDYVSFSFRYEDGGKFRGITISDMDSLFSYMIDFLEESGALTIAFAQGGDFIGGANGNFKKGITRKAMNTFFYKTDTLAEFTGMINEDVNMYCTLGSRGAKIFTIFAVSVNQQQTQANAGGLTDIYLDSGTYVKSFYSVMCCPSSIKVAVMGDGHYRLHHAIEWNATVPKILNEKWRKG